MNPSGTSPADDIDLDDDTIEDDDPMELVADEWEGLGWVSILPTAAAEMLYGADEVSNSRETLVEAATGSVSPGLIALDDDPLWPVLSAETYPDNESDDPELAGTDLPPVPPYEEYLDRQRELRQRWRELLGRHGEPPVETPDELISLLIRWGLLAADTVDGSTAVEFVADLPDPVELLPLSEEALQEFAMDELQNDIDAVMESLHDFLYHSDESEQTLRIGPMADKVGVDPEQVALALAMLVAEADSGITAHRRGPQGEQQLDAKDFEDLPAHARFVLRVDRSAAGFPDHVED